MIININYKKLGLTERYEVPGRFRKLREACRNNFNLFSSKSIQRIPSYDQKPSEVNEY